MSLRIVLLIIMGLLVINTTGAIITVFHRPRSIPSTLAWLLVLVMLPGVGFLLYAFLGRGIAEENLFALSHQDHIGLAHLKKLILQDMKKLSQSKRDSNTTDDARGLIDYFDRSEDSPVTQHNKVRIFTDGKDKFKNLFMDIKIAQRFIHVEYYSFINDEIGNEFLNLLVRKAQQGVEVRLIYDPWGSAGANKKWFAPLTDAGGEVVPFITSRDLIRKTRLNYHLHRKVVIIDGKVGWTGGFNVGDQYLGRSKKFGYWRDTHIRIVGTSVLALQERFLMDWNASIERYDQRITFKNEYFPNPSKIAVGHTPIQIVSDGPDTEEDTLKGGMMKMLMTAKKSVWIQTPYLVPDEPMLSSLIIAARSGIDVRIMIPQMPDHPFIYRATQYYANLLTEAGIKIYVYENGFLHAKTTICDNEFCFIGSMNQDYRSYALNFECNAYIYDSKVSQELTDIFENDMKKSTLLTTEIIRSQSHWLHFKQYFSRLLSPIL
ncbi:cardiolipin synthase [Lapidilactobacillus dextrinicus]|uniref:cardiolipin synthase n=1 Tax=Lapidilactobacillus dextrinicus TaxID=51664 RepID=UPI00124A25BE|nr:cardiolipin synthase [Lapidilactobacillus dextrinicus]QFG47444.1 cardiolipin synthase [Lapidilactobacillus dextrinicus]